MLEFKSRWAKRINIDFTKNRLQNQLKSKTERTGNAIEGFEDDVIRGLTDDDWNELAKADRNIYDEIIQWGIEDEDFNIEDCPQ